MCICREVGPTGSDPRTRTSIKAVELLSSDADMRDGRTSASDTVHMPSIDRSATTAGPSTWAAGTSSAVQARPIDPAGKTVGSSFLFQNFVPEQEDSGVLSSDRRADSIARHSTFGIDKSTGEVKPPPSESETDRVS